MKYLKVLLVAVIGVGLLCNLDGTAEENINPEFDMKKKLEYSKNILDGLVSEDFDKILKNARAINKLGERKWLENESVQYRTQNQLFWFTAGTLALAQPARPRASGGARHPGRSRTGSGGTGHRALGMMWSPRRGPSRAGLHPRFR